ncbi:MAG: DNA mismatch repair endonuclease MutL [Desulfotalea sp.]
MSKIRVLSEQIANQIAAGEVVERPASVVKEIIENSIDAGASRINVEIEGGGTRLIRIIDDGEGMDADDILLCLERHGTSKIKTENDLAAINTLGFRGEAIPSIGSVSILTIMSRTLGNDLGHKIELKFGKLMASHEVGCQLGTTVEIKNLFGNTPARRKFLKTARTELSHIDEVIKNYSLACPQIAFILKIDGRETINLNTSQNLDERLAKILRSQVKFMKVNYKSHDYKVTGLLLPPESARPGPAKLKVFVNGRAIKDRSIYHATIEGMRGFLMKGHNPAGLLMLEIPPSEIDVNVHPAKDEIRFRSTREVHNLINMAVKDSLLNQQNIIRDSIFSSSDSPMNESVSVEKIPVPSTSHSLNKEKKDELSSYNLSEKYSPQDFLFKKKKPTNVESDKPNFVIPEQVVDNVYARDSENSKQTPEIIQTSERDPQQSTKVSTDSVTEHVRKPHGVEYMGQVTDLYLFCKTPDGVVVIDQHAAHERLLFEKLKKNYSENKVVKQNLLFPETVELSIFQSQLVENNMQELERMGFSIRDFGGNHYVISAIPAVASNIAPQTIFFDILEQYGNEGSSRMKGDTIDTILATVACRAAVKGGTSLQEQEVTKLLNDMADANLFSHCPHGRPVVRKFSSDEINKWFHRP